MSEISYIKVELSKNNAFMCPFSCSIFNRMQGGIVEIDTGASSSFIPFNALGNNRDDCMFAKKYLLNKQSNKMGVLSGVEGIYSSISNSEFEQMSFEEKMNFKGLIFYGSIINLSVNDYYIASSCRFTISFDSSKKYALLGMDILKYFDFHIGVSNITDKCTFIGCLKDKITNEYLDALYAHFGYVSDKLVLQACDNARVQGYIAGCWKDYLKNYRDTKSTI